MRFSFNLALALFAIAPVAFADITATWNGTTGNWTDAARWSTAPVFPNNSGPNLFGVVLNAGIASLDQPITINQIGLGGGTLDGAFTLTALEGLQWTAGAVQGSGILSLGASAMTNITSGPAALTLDARTIDNFGTATFTTGRIVGGSGAQINNRAGATFTMHAGTNFFANTGSPLYTFNNAGTFTARNTGGLGFSTTDAVFNNTGTMRVENTGVAHTFSLAGGGTQSGPVDLALGTTLELGGVTTLNSGAAFTGSGTTVIAGSVVVSGSISASVVRIAVGELNVGSSLFHALGTATQTGGSVRLASGTFRVANGSGTFVLDDGILTGSGTLDANLETQGAISPGAGLGKLSVSGDIAFGGDATLNIEIGGTSAAAIDLLAVSGAAELGGVIRVTLANGFTPSSENIFTILTADSGLSGTFFNAPSNLFRFTTMDGLGSFAISYTPASVVLLQYVPEPTAPLLLGVGGIVWMALGRRRSTTTVS
jgi:hypothetical protein